ncbi:hypothetical protein [Flavicella sediminum]|uniref:hypothetical protein n=1 Tax=Flavicella sediminum TaxID=2585141 RepID=UPI00112461C3|nr:hypothetical protein [Flavicella sediminum]
MKKTLFTLSFLMILTSCSQRVMDFTIVSSKNLEFSKFPTYKKGNTRVSGKDKKPIIIIIPTGYPNGKEAMDRAIESVPGAVALLDGVLTYKWFYIPYIYGEYIYIIEGTPLIDPNLVSTSEIEKQNDFSVCILNREGNIEKNITLTETKYYDLKTEIFKHPKKTYRKLLK